MLQVRFAHPTGTGKPKDGAANAERIKTRERTVKDGMPENEQGKECYADKTDEEIALLARDGDDQAQEVLLNKYKNFVRSKARSYFLIGADHEDIVQEGMIGLFKAIRDFRRAAGSCSSSSSGHLRNCASPGRSSPPSRPPPGRSTSRSIPMSPSYRPIYDEESDRTLMDVLSEVQMAGPEELLISQEDYSSVENRISEVLSDLEMEVLTSYLEGKSYQEIAHDLNRHVKSIDNALQRVKRKLDKITGYPSGSGRVKP